MIRRMYRDYKLGKSMSQLSKLLQKIQKDDFDTDTQKLDAIVTAEVGLGTLLYGIQGDLATLLKETGASKQEIKSTLTPIDEEIEEWIKEK